MCERCCRFEAVKSSAEDAMLLPEPTAPEIHRKGWGYEEWFCNNKTSNYCGKRLVFEQGKQCSWHFHPIKDETFYIETGQFLVFLGWGDDLALAEERVLKVGDCLHIPPGLRHRMRAVALGSSSILEFSSFHWEEDSIRLEKGD